MNAILGQKKGQTSKFLSDGTRIPVTLVEVMGNPVVMVKTQPQDGYWAVQLGYGMKKKPTKAIAGHIKGAKLDKAPRFFREVRFTNDSNADTMPKVGDVISAESVVKAGDRIDVVGVSKGKGFAGGVKRYHFRGGPATHGQSDRHRAPGSIGSGTTPGRVYKGKRMAGKMGNDTVTVRNLVVVAVEGTTVWVKGLIPGTRNALVMLEVKGDAKKFVPIYKDEAVIANEVKQSQEEVKEEVKSEPADAEAIVDKKEEVK